MKQEHPFRITDVVERSYEKEIIQCKYSYIEKVVQETLFHKNKKARSTDKIDRVLTHPVWGVPMFLLIMVFVFFLTFTVGDACLLYTSGSAYYPGERHQAGAGETYFLQH